MKFLPIFCLMIFMAFAFPQRSFCAEFSVTSSAPVSAEEIKQLTTIAVDYTASVQKLAKAPAKEVKRMHRQHALSIQLDNAEFVADGTTTQAEADASVNGLKQMSDAEWKSMFLASLQGTGILELNLTELQNKLLSGQAEWQRVSPTKIQAAFDKLLPQPYNLMTFTFRRVDGKWIVL